MRIVLVAQLLHLHLVFLADALVTTFVEEDGRVVAVVYDGVPHQFHPLFPVPSPHVLLGVSRGHSLYESHTVARLDVLLPWTHVHPSHEITAREHHQLIAVVAQPCRHRHTHSRPFVGCALSISVHHHNTVVQIGHSIAEGSLAESCRGGLSVYYLSLDSDTGVHIIQIAISPRPEMQSFHHLLRTDSACLALVQCDWS